MYNIANTINHKRFTLRIKSFKMITMADIAKETNVSQTTVSMVLNDKANKIRISNKTSQRVMDTARKLGYCPNEAARTVRNGKSNSISIISWVDNTFTQPIINGIVDQIDGMDYSTKLLPVNAQSDMLAVFQDCISHRIAGVIMIIPFSSKWVELAKDIFSKHNIPLVIQYDTGISSGDFFIKINEYDAIDESIKYLTELGHSKICHLGGPNDQSYAKDRWCIFQKGMIKNQLQCTSKEQIMISDCRIFTPADVKSMQQLLNDYTACICDSDFAACKLLHIAQLEGIKVPKDFSIIGFGDLDFSSVTPPPLTTIQQPFKQYGRSAADLLMYKMNMKLNIDTSEIKVKLIKRNSTAKVNNNK